MCILPYLSMPAEFCAYDPQVVEVAHRLAAAIWRAEPRLKVEHVGSTSVPGCGGKGILDLAVLYPEDFLARSDSFNFLNPLGDTIVTGPTGTNVRDLRLVLRTNMPL